MGVLACLYGHRVGRVCLDCAGLVEWVAGRLGALCVEHRTFGDLSIYIYICIYAVEKKRRPKCVESVKSTLRFILS